MHGSADTAITLDQVAEMAKELEAAGVETRSPDGRTPTQQLKLLRQAIELMHQTMTETWERTLKPLLREQAGLVIGIGSA